LAFNTIKLRKEPHIIRVIREIIHKNVNIVLNHTFLLAFFPIFAFVSTAFIKSFVQIVEGTTLVVIL
jgi:hypothetical protein